MLNQIPNSKFQINFNYQNTKLLSFVFLMELFTTLSLPPFAKEQIPLLSPLYESLWVGQAGG